MSLFQRIPTNIPRIQQTELPVIVAWQIVLLKGHNTYIVHSQNNSPSITNNMTFTKV